MKVTKKLVEVNALQEPLQILMRTSVVITTGYKLAKLAKQVNEHLQLLREAVNRERDGKEFNEYLSSDGMLLIDKIPEKDLERIKKEFLDANSEVNNLITEMDVEIDIPEIAIGDFVTSNGEPIDLNDSTVLISLLDFIGE